MTLIGALLFVYIIIFAVIGLIITLVGVAENHKQWSFPDWILVTILFIAIPVLTAINIYSS